MEERERKRERGREREEEIQSSNKILNDNRPVEQLIWVLSDKI